jgi:hypothetical protein
VEERKIKDYLLSEERSGGKAGFFAAFGFTGAQWARLRHALRQHAATYEVASVSETDHGVKFIIEGEIATPDGRSPLVRAVWIIDAGRDTPRFVTAYPLEGSNR